MKSFRFNERPNDKFLTKLPEHLTEAIKSCWGLRLYRYHSQNSTPSLQQRRATLRAMSPSYMAIIRSLRETCIYRFRSNSVQRYDNFPLFHPRNPHTFLHPFSTNRSHNDDHAAAIHLAYARICAGGVYAKSYVFASVIYTCMHEDVNICRCAHERP